jgi:DNA-binding transcriptional LysR family regulator
MTRSPLFSVRSLLFPIKSRLGRFWGRSDKGDGVQVPGVNGIDLNLLVTLGAILEERNLTRAGAKLNLSQPTMSGALARLRRHFGDELLVRSGRRYELSPAAEKLLPVVRVALRQVELTFDETGLFDPATSVRRFSIGVFGQSIVMLAALLRQVRELAPGVRFDLRAMPLGLANGDRGKLQHDLLIGPMGFYQPGGQPEVLYRDRFVCVLDPANPCLVEGSLSLPDLAKLPHASAILPHAIADPVSAELERRGVKPTIAMAATGWLPVTFMVAGTDMVAVVPERLARIVGRAAGVAVVEPPFGTIEFIEAAWWHPLRATDPALTWLRAQLAAHQ